MKMQSTTRVMTPPGELRTPRLLLRFPVAEDARAIFDRYATDETVTRYVMWTPHQTLETVAEYVRDRIQRIATGEEFTWAITQAGTVPGDDRPIGMIGARVRAHKVDIGYVLMREHWNKGYMTEAICVVADWMLEQREIFRVWAVCDVENPGSARALEKSGFRREGVLARWVVHPNRDGTPRDCYIYSRTR